jgi:hypothetical protein
LNNQMISNDPPLRLIRGHFEPEMPKRTRDLASLALDLEQSNDFAGL